MGRNNKGPGGGMPTHRTSSAARSSGSSPAAAPHARLGPESTRGTAHRAAGSAPRSPSRRLRPRSLPQHPLRAAARCQDWPLAWPGSGGARGARRTCTRTRAAGALAAGHARQRREGAVDGRDDQAFIGGKVDSLVDDCAHEQVVVSIRSSKKSIKLKIIAGWQCCH